MAHLVERSPVSGDWLSEFTASYINLLPKADVLAPNTAYQLCSTAPPLERWLSTAVPKSKRIPRCFTNTLLAF